MLSYFLDFYDMAGPNCTEYCVLGKSPILRLSSLVTCFRVMLSLASCSSYSSKGCLTAEADSRNSPHQDELDSVRDSREGKNIRERPNISPEGMPFGYNGVEESPVDSEHILKCQAQESFPVTVDVDMSRPIGKFRRIWRFFGADEANYVYMENGEKLIRELGELAPPGDILSGS